MSGAGSKKRVHADMTDEGNFVYLFPFDSPFNPVLTDIRLLDQFDCHLSKKIKHERPDMICEGKPGYAVTVGRSLLTAFLKSLLYHEFILPKDVTYQEATRFFEYEGIGLPGNDIAPSQLPDGAVEMPPMGIGMRKQTDAVQAITDTAQMVTNAILEWPRLEFGLNAALSGNDAGFTCSSTRVWVAFVQRPQMQRYGGDEIHALARRRPYWLIATLGSIGWLHWRMCQMKRIEADARDQESFMELVKRGANVDSARYFLSTKRDMPKCERDRHRGMCRHADLFAAHQINLTVEHGPIKSTSGAPHAATPKNVKFARACVALAERLVQDTPNCARLFSGICSEKDGKGEVVSTAERRALEKALKTHNLRILSWRESCPDDVKPLIFPPSFRSNAAWGVAPCCLITTDK